MNEVSEQPAQGSGAYPVAVSARLSDSYVRFLPLVKWLLLIPHYFALFFLGIGAAVVAFIALFATLFTGTYPRGMWDFMVGVQRWVLRVYAYMLLMTDQYPPFTLAETAGDDVRLTVEYPEKVERWRPFIAWLLILPYAIVASLILLVAQVCSFLAFFTIIFTKKIPDGIFDVMRIGLNWSTRSSLYGYWMSVEYPPFSWDDE
jgi:hypothetical protein